MGIPYTGCGVSASAISMNKDITKRVLSIFPDIPLIKSVNVTKDDYKQKVEELNYTFNFTKDDLFYEYEGKMISYFNFYDFHFDDSNPWRIGAVLLRKYPIAFDYEKKVLGFSLGKKEIIIPPQREKDKKKNGKTVGLVIALILVILISIFVVLFSIF